METAGKWEREGIEKEGQRGGNDSSWKYYQEERDVRQKVLERNTSPIVENHLVERKDWERGHRLEELISEHLLKLGFQGRKNNQVIINK